MALRVPCPQCGKVPPPDCDCPPLPPGPPDPVEETAAGGAPSSAARPRLRPEFIKMRREKRAGREVIVLEGFPRHVDLGAMARALRTLCASGGTAKNGTIEIQGDHRDRIAAFLLEQGFRSKRAGG